MNTLNLSALFLGLSLSTPTIQSQSPATDSLQASSPSCYSQPTDPKELSANGATGRLFGFLLGTATAGAGMYYYVIDEYRVSNQLLTEDIYALQSAVQRIEGYVRTLEEKVGEKRH